MYSTDWLFSSDRLPVPQKFLSSCETFLALGAPADGSFGLFRTWTFEGYAVCPAMFTDFCVYCCGGRWGGEGFCWPPAKLLAFWPEELCEGFSELCKGFWIAEEPREDFWPAEFKGFWFFVGRESVWWALGPCAMVVLAAWISLWEAGVGVSGSLTCPGLRSSLFLPP